MVLFEEILPEQAVDDSYRAIQGCDLLLLIGSSLVVYPVAGFPGVGPPDSHMAVINNEATAWGPDADVWLAGDIADQSAALSTGLGFN